MAPDREFCHRERHLFLRAWRTILHALASLYLCEERGAVILSPAGAKDLLFPGAAKSGSFAARAYARSAQDDKPAGVLLKETKNQGAERKEPACHPEPR